MKSLTAPCATAAVVTALLALPLALPTSAAAAGETCDGRPATIVGTGKIQGTPGDDVIVATGDSVSVDAGAGDDLICVEAPYGATAAGAGDDVVDATTVAKSGSPHADLGPGSDRYLGGAARDLVDSGPASGVGVVDHDVITTGDNKDYVTVSQPNTDVATQNGKDQLTVATSGSVRAGSLRLGRARDDLRIAEPTDALVVDLRHRRLSVGAGHWPLIGDERAEVIGRRVHLIGDRHRNVLAATSCAAKISGGSSGDELVFFASNRRASRCGDDISARVYGGDGQDQLVGIRGRTLLDGGPGLDRATGRGRMVTCHAERTHGC